jgi:Icc protein
MKLYGTHLSYREDLGRKTVQKYYCYMNNEGTFRQTESVTRILLMSDLHSATPKIIEDLLSKGIITKTTVVLSCGDMAGNGKFGDDSDPTESYKVISANARAFYFVQGNHDLPNPEAMALRNDDGTPCAVHGICVDTIIGRIGGVNGIIGDPYRNERYDHKTYSRLLKDVIAQQPDILLTHQPPTVAATESEVSYGPQRVPVHVCGHYPYEGDFMVHSQYGLVLNCDSRILDIGIEI